MTDHKFTDDEVEKALECCAGNEANCKSCPLDAACVGKCIPAMSKAATDLIKRQRAEIDALKIANEKMYAAAKEQEAEIEQLKEELNATIAGQETLLKFMSTATPNKAITYFAERIKERMQDLSRLQNGDTTLFLVGEYFIDNLVKEMTEDNSYIKGIRTMTPEERERHYLGKWVTGTEEKP